MCSRLCQVERKPIRVGETVFGFRPDNTRVEGKWGGFARSETLDRWAVWEPIEIPVTGFAERSKVTGRNVWDWTERTIQAIHFKGQVNLVTREATLEEKDFFDHHRVPTEVGHDVQEVA